MKPPICEICNKRINSFDNAGVINFKKTPADIEWDKRCEEEGFVGHPPYAEWFCELHYPQAKQLESLTRFEAMRELKKSQK